MINQDSQKLPIHRFAIGQTVRLQSSMSLRTAELYRITGTLPSRDNSPQYRIRSDQERHERVTTEDSLEEVEATPFRKASSRNRRRAPQSQKPESGATEPAEGFGSAV